MKKKERVINHVLKADKHLPLFISAFKVGERIRSEKKIFSSALYQSSKCERTISYKPNYIIDNEI